MQESLLMQWINYYENPELLIEEHFKTLDLTRGQYVQYILFNRQKEIVQKLADPENFRHLIITKPRQAGVSTTVAAYCAYLLAFASDKKPEKIVVVANKLKMAKEMLKKIRNFLKQVPKWIWGDYYDHTKETEGYIMGKGSTEHLRLLNGCEVVALATSEDTLRGHTPTHLIIDEAAFIERGDELYSAAMMSTATGGRVILISTPNGYDRLYYRVYRSTLDGSGAFHLIEMQWYQDPRYNKDLTWLKTMADGKVESIAEVEFTDESFKSKIREGYKPTSSWYRAQCAILNNDKIKIAQELDVKFEGSAGNVVESEHIKRHKDEYVQDPIFTDPNEKLFHIYTQPKEGHEYVMGIDGSSGNSDDFSAISILDMTTGEQVADFKGKLRPENLAQLAIKWAIIYNALVVIDMTGGYGDTIGEKFEDVEYPNLYYREVGTLNSQFDRLENRKLLGLKITSLRPQIIGKFTFAVENDLIKLRSKRTCSELDTFVYVNGRPNHMEGYNDDSIFATAIAWWVVEKDYKNMKKAKAMDAALLSALMSINDQGRQTNTQALRNAVNNVKNKALEAKELKEKKASVVKKYGWGL